MLSKQEIQRYQKHLSLGGFGVEGQSRLKAAKVLIVGMGGLGTPVALYLSAMGVGTLGLFDFDRVDPTNLHRQIIYHEDDVGQLKVEAARNYLQKQNSLTNIQIFPRAFTLDDVNILNDFDLVVDGTDQFAMRYLLNDVCRLKGIGYVFGAIQGMRGMCALFCPGRGPCYRCLFPEEPPKEMFPTCALDGVLGITPGLVGMLQATEVIQYCAHLTSPLNAIVHTVCVTPLHFQRYELERDPECPLCSGRITQLDLLHPITEAPLEITFHAMRKLQATGAPVQIVDIRTHEERNAGGVIETSVHIPLSELKNSSRQLLNPECTIVCYCRSGCRSLTAVDLLKQAGFEKVFSLQNGLRDIRT